MHHIPRFFSNKKVNKDMDSKKNSRKPRLERRNAAKHIDYNATSSSSSSSIESSPSPSLHTRSLDLSDKMSFRVEGTDGEFDRICRSLGLSGPEDFAISLAAWEARKIRSSSDLLPRSRLYPLDSPSDSKREQEEEDGGAAVDELCERVMKTAVIRDFTELTRAHPAQSSGCCSPDDSYCAGGDTTVGGGIKGVRPPLLKPPPSMRLPEVDLTSSTWDILRDFAPDDKQDSTRMAVEDYASSDEDREEEEQEQEDKVEQVLTKVVVEDRGRDVPAGGLAVVAENAPLYETCSFTTSNDDDSSSSTTEPSNISPNGRFKRNITYWQKGELLGRGSFGSVYEGIADDGFFFAVKEVSLLDQGDQGKQSIYQLEQEIALLSQFEHENIVQYYGTDTDDSKLYIFLELVTKGSLQRLYQRYNLRDSQVSAYTRQILLGLKYLHDRNVVHRDIKCANILVDANGSVKLADFGLAKATKLNDVKSTKGTACWMAPEVVNRKGHGYGLPADIWSLGCTVLEMLTQKIPYSDLEWMQALFKIGKGVPPTVPDSLSEEARDFIFKCLQVNADARLTAAQLLEHPFVKKPLPTTSGSASPYIFGVRG
ncbi:mitogen-activated protein kinase kinase kinase 1-like [Humulus lupulus]|uniref:mitogen-activated protein kinase kinase kinase 1-like n=1 Tax=Humulus lupulus TaxID=3486 RepID=UPI002B404830|nr:mitogen-activated protein kinase kinase kinase 1-like [Humulus lupulus]